MGAIRFCFDGRDLHAAQGDSIAAALGAAGETTLGYRRSGAARGVFCGMGVCHDCLVTVDGRRGLRACMTPVREGMEVRREDDRRLASGTVLPTARASQLVQAEIAVIGAGPAGLEAAVRAANAGADVVVLDEREEAGGQYFKPRSEGFRGRRVRDRQHLRGDELRARAAASGARILYAQKHLVCAAPRGGL